jgi:hypothetical protein
MLVAGSLAVCALVIAFAYAKRRRTKFNAEATARMRAISRRRWSQWLEEGKPEPPHEETYVEYQERKRRGG